MTVNIPTAAMITAGAAALVMLGRTLQLVTDLRSRMDRMERHIFFKLEG
jgi:hypothetical protein